MFYLFRVFILLFVMLLSIQSLDGKDYHLSDLVFNSDIAELSLRTDSGDNFMESLSIKDLSSGEVNRVSLDNIRTGIVLLKSKDYEVVKLRGENFSIFYGGELTIDYLYSGLTNKMKQEHIVVTSNYNIVKEGIPVHTMRFVENKLFGKTIGIKKIIFNE